MRGSSRLPAPYRLVVLFALVALVPSALLVAFGWRMLRQEQVIERAQLQTRREQSADLVVAALERSVSDAERFRDSAPGHVTLPEGAVVVHTEGDRISAVPERRLLYLPVVGPLPEAPSSPFADLDSVEYRDRDPAAAVTLARKLAQSRDPAIRAAAFIRLARNLRMLGEADQALRSYAAAAQIEGVAVESVPVDLLARWARCVLLEDRHRIDELRREAAQLRGDLLDGRWKLTRAVWELHFTDSSRWAGIAVDANIAAERRLLTEAVQALWTRAPAMRLADREAFIRHTIPVGGTDVTVLALSEDDRFAAFLATPRFVRDHWLSKAVPIVQSQNLRLSIAGPVAPPAEASTVVRRPGDTGLPWNLAIEPLHIDADHPGLRRRQLLWTIGLALVVVLALTGTWIVARAVTRELAVARLQSDFVAAVSHEFRTPLTTMAQLTEMLVDGRTTDDRRATHYEALARQTERLRRLVERLLDFGRMEAGRAPYRYQLLEVAGWVRSVVQQFDRDPASGGHRVHLEMPDDAGAISGDREALTNALWNLLENAVKYSPAAAEIWVKVYRRGRSIAVEVRDAGFGIPRGEQKEIFRTFVRGTRARVENIKGTGVGLALVQHVVRAHAGAVTVRSEPEAGSVFTLILPASDEGDARCLAS